MIRKLAAHYIFPVSSPPLKYGIIVCNSDGRILEIIDNKGIFREVASLEFYNGILVPGFVKVENQTDQNILKNLKLRFMQDENVTLNETLQKEEGFGMFEIGKSPGINLISPVDFIRMRLTGNSQLQILIP